MSLTITALSREFGARIEGVRIPEIDKCDWTSILGAFYQYGILIFTGQFLSEEEQVAFGERFGEVEYLRPNVKHVPVSNLDESGYVLSQGSRFYEGLRGNESWHIDSSNMPLSAKASVLTAQVVPRKGGETEFADLRDAYDRLDPATRERISGLSACHSLYASQKKAGYKIKTGDAYGYHRLGMPVRPLVKVHPVTGRKALYVSEDAFRIPGLDDDEAESLLSALLEFAVKPERTLAHRWNPGDVIVWDNRCVLHRARPYDYNQPRVLRHVRIAGDLATEMAETIPDEHADLFDPSRGHPARCSLFLLAGQKNDVVDIGRRARV